MEAMTTQKSSFKPFDVNPGKREMKTIAINDAPIANTSSYQAEFPNWQNGKGDIYHEKQPQYPYYSLPFRGDSSYKMNFTEEQMKELKKHQKLIETLGQASSNGGANSSLK